MGCSRSGLTLAITRPPAIELRKFVGWRLEEIAAAKGITEYLVRRKWTYARAWLRDAFDA